MTLQPPLSDKKQSTVISAYTPTMTSPKEVKEKFYDDLNTLNKSMPRCDKLILLCDFNARVGTDYKTWSNVIGKNGVDKCNSNGLLILQSCAKHGLLITNTLFHLHTHNKTSWMHPWSKHWHLIAYVIMRRDLQGVRVTKALCGAECWTDHRLIITKLNVCIKPPQQPWVRGSLWGSISPSCNLLLSDNCYMKTLSRSSLSSNVQDRCQVKLDCPEGPSLLYCSTPSWPKHVQTPGLVWWKQHWNPKALVWWIQGSSSLSKWYLMPV